MKLVVVAAAAAAVAAAAWMLWPDGHTPARRPPSEAAVPATAGVPGEAVFNQRCAVCHGLRGVGSPQGPPLVHRYYEPGHHSDMSFVLAVRRGVRAHHWRFGNMPPVPGLSDADLKEVIRYVRALQRANGIF